MGLCIRAEEVLPTWTGKELAEAVGTCAGPRPQAVHEILIRFFLRCTRWCCGYSLTSCLQQQQQQHLPEGWPSCRGRGSSVASQVPTIVGDLAGEAKSQPEPCTERCDEHYSLSWARCRSSRLPYHHLCLRGLGGSWHGRAPRREVVLAVGGPAEIKRAARLLRVLRHVGTVGGAVGVPATWRRSRCCRCSSSTRLLSSSCSSSSNSPGCARAVHRRSVGHFSCAQKGYAQCKLCRRPHMLSTSHQQRQVLTEVRILLPQIQLILRVVNIPVVQQISIEFHRCSSWWSGRLLTCP